MVKNPPSNTGDMGSISDGGIINKIQLPSGSQGHTPPTTDLLGLEPALRSRRSLNAEKVNTFWGDSLAVQWLGVSAFTA